MAICKSATMLVLLVAAECLTALPVAESETSTPGEEVDPPAATPAGDTTKLAIDGGDATAGPEAPAAEDSGDPAVAGVSGEPAVTAGSGDTTVEDSTGGEAAGENGDGDPTASSPAAAGDSGSTEEASEATQPDSTSEVVGVEVEEDVVEEGPNAADMEGAETMVFRPLFAFYPGDFQ